MKSELCVDIGVVGVGFDEVSARCHVLAHEHGEDAVSFCGVADGDTLEQTVLWTHGGVAELLVAHLTETFVTLHLGALAVFGYELCHLGIGPAIFLHTTHLALVERRSGEVEIAVFDDGSHAAEEECHQQRGDVASVHVGIGHDDDLVICELGDVDLLGVILGADGDAHGFEKACDFLVFKDFVIHGFLHVEDFASEG